MEIIDAAVADKSPKGNSHLQQGNIGASNISINPNGNVDIVKIDDLKLAHPTLLKLT